MSSEKSYSIRVADETDLTIIIDMLIDDPFAKLRENDSAAEHDIYLNAFRKIQSDPNANIYVICDNGMVIGFAQLNFLTHLTYQGGVRAQIESVRVHKNQRGKGIGSYFFTQLIDIAKRHGCHLVQLTTDKQRSEALKFYENLGFIHSHHGMKLHFTN